MPLVKLESDIREMPQTDRPTRPFPPCDLVRSPPDLCPFVERKGIANVTRFQDSTQWQS